jgi:protein ImuB
MTRYACLYVAGFQAAAHVRAEPALADRALAVLAGRAPARRVVEATAAARAAGVVPGVTESEARARCASLVTRAVSADRAAAARHALLEAVLGVSPRIEDADDGVVHADLAGLARLFGDDVAVGERLHRAARRAGLTATVVIAGSRTAARLLARVATRLTVVPPGGDRAALAPLPVATLALPADLAATLTAWGVRSLGDLAALPREGLGVRLGAAGLRAQDEACGVDRAPFRPWTPPPYWEEAQALDWEIGTWELLAPVLGAVIERLTGRLAAAHLAADGVQLELELASGARDERFVTFAHPLAEPGPMLALIALDVGARPPGAAITRVSVSARMVLPAPGQRGLWQLPVPAGRDLATTLARLQSLVGPDRVGAPVVLDSHRADAVALGAFAPPPRDGDLARDAACDVLAAPLAFRRLRPPRVVEVETGRGEPVRVTLGARPEPIVARVGPWRTSGEWWSARGWARDEWDVALRDGMICRLAHDRLADKWYLDGAYD